MLATLYSHQYKSSTLFGSVGDAGGKPSHDQRRPDAAGLLAGLVAKMVALKWWLSRALPGSPCNNHAAPCEAGKAGESEASETGEAGKAGESEASETGESGGNLNSSSHTYAVAMPCLCCAYTVGLTGSLG